MAVTRWWREPVRIIQPNIQNMVSFDATAAEAGYARLLRMSREACDEPGALLVWPESASWPLAWDEDEQLRRDVEELTERGCSVVLNSVRSAGEKYFNSVYLVAPGEPARSADKRHLVPFGEYVPLKSVLPFIGKLARNAGDFSAAEEISLLPWGGESFGAAVCFEVVFPGEVAAAVTPGRHATGDGHQRRLVWPDLGALATFPRRAVPRRGEPPAAAAGRDHRRLRLGASRRLDRGSSRAGRGGDSARPGRWAKRSLAIHARALGGAGFQCADRPGGPDRAPPLGCRHSQIAIGT